MELQVLRRTRKAQIVKQPEVSKKLYEISTG
jgi:hypothetical protein